MTAVLLYLLGKSISEWREKKVGESQNTKSASKIFYPSVTMLPLFERQFSLAKLKSFKTRKNLTEYNLKTSHIKEDIISIKQKYELGNRYDNTLFMYSLSLLSASRTSTIDLNNSTYSLHPNLFKVHKYPDLSLYMKGNDGLQEFATYNPPGPTQPGADSKVSYFQKVSW